jgi:hypothetical protein
LAKSKATFAPSTTTKVLNEVDELAADGGRGAGA